MNGKKTLVAFFSRAGMNYVEGRIVWLSVGNTERVAALIGESLGADLFKIDTVKPYPDDYDEATDAAKKELKENARPALSSKLENLGDYELVFLGFPNWWGTMPMAVFGFLETHDFSGKTIIPFCTHEGSGMGRSEADIKRLCPNSRVLPGHAIKGSDSKNARGELSAWLGTLKATH